MQAKTMRKLTLGEWMSLTLLADRIRREVDGTLADLVDRVAAGDDTALVPAVDRMMELGWQKEAESLKATVLEGGGPTFAAGQRVEWLYETRRGYGYRWWVPAVVVKVGPKRVTIDAERTDGTTKRVAVTVERLRALAAA